ncbi:exo-alpha-sialidase [Nocardioides sp. J2M5]|uniref:sialidase family protein n=1 Tax=Nocardioides palaemonis TaxID=2829810 RepID=UPI001BA697D4|nr:sialidase family protein [Nocardioides palaemonis]MBS2939180.1 exo-alpha-sialidase [Nocardioides palaemonis]
MSLPTDLPHAVAERAPQPGFDEVLDRARTARRRRRRTAGAYAAAAVAMAGAVAAVVLLPGSTPVDPAPAPSPTPLTGEVDDRLPAAVRGLVEADRADVFAVSASGDAVAALWANCSGEAGANGCRSAVTVREGSDVAGVLLDGDVRALQPVPGGWLVEQATGPLVLDPDGRLQPLVDTGPGNDRSARGDTAVTVGGAVRLLRGTTLVDVPVPPGTTRLWGAHVTFTGRLAVVVDLEDGGSEVAVSDDFGATWSAGTTERADATTGRVLAGDGDRLVLVDLGDDRSTGEVPLLDVRTSRDGGATWQEAHGLGWGGGPDRAWQLPRDLSGVAVAPDGTTFLTTASHHLVRIDLDGNALPTQLSSYDRGVTETPDGVCVLTERGRRDQLACSADGGTTWEPRAVPGLR